MRIAYSCSDIDAALGRLEVAEEAAGEVRAALDTVFTELDAARDEFEGARKINKELRDELENAQKTIEDLKGELEDKAHEIGNLEHERDDLKEEVSRLRDELASMEVLA